MRYLLLLLLCCAGLGVAHAQSAAKQSADTTQSNQIRELLVTARRFPADRFDTPEAIRPVDQKAIRFYQPRTSPEALMNVPGVFVQKTNHGGGSPFLRGLTGNQVLMLVDGVRLNNATFRYGPNQYFNTIDIFNTARMEVLYGSGSVQYGSDALGGVIQVLTPELMYADKIEYHARAAAKVMTQGMEQSGRAEIGLSGKKAAFRGGFTYRNFGDLIGGDTTGRQAPSGYDEYAFDLKTVLAAGKHLNITLMHQGFAQNHVPVYHKIQLENFNLNEFQPQTRALSYAKIEGKSHHAWAEQFSLTLSRQASEEGRLSRKNGSATRREENDRVASIGAVALLGSRFSRIWSANSGIEVYHDRVTSSRQDVDETTQVTVQKRGLYPDGSTMSSAAVFSLHEFNFNSLKINAGARYNTYNIQVKDETLGAVSLQPGAFVWNAAIQYRWTAGFTSFLSYNSTFRAPNIDDLGTLGIVDFRYEVPNYDLKPESGHNVQLGVKWRSKGFEMETYLFRNELRNIINRIKVPDQVIQGYAVYQKENAEKAYIHGAESSFNWRFLPSLELGGHIAYAFGRNMSRFEPVRRIPPLNGRLYLQYTAPFGARFQAEYLGAGKQYFLAQGDRDDNRIPKGGTPAWNILNFFAGYKWKSLAFQAGVHNLLNADYRLHGSGVNGPGRSAWLGVDWTF